MVTVCRSVHATWSLKSWNLPVVTNSFPSGPHVETDRQRSTTVQPLYQTRPRPDRCPPPRALPPLRTQFLPPSILGRWMRNLSLWPSLTVLDYYLIVLIRVTIWIREILTLLGDFSISVFESIPELSINTKSWIKGVIQGFAQKVVKLNTNMS